MKKYSDEFILNAFDEAKTLNHLKTVCEHYHKPQDKAKLRTIYSRSNDKILTTKSILKNFNDVSINDAQAARLTNMIQAFLNKKPYRETITESVKNKLLISQDYKCAYCKKPIDSHSHADHIVPFKYVGDELKGNLQMLCSECNLKKNDSIDYQIRFLIR